jgi:hypothetical protein
MIEEGSRRVADGRMTNDKRDAKPSTSYGVPPRFQVHNIRRYHSTFQAIPYL